MISCIAIRVITKATENSPEDCGDEDFFSSVDSAIEYLRFIKAEDEFVEEEEE